LNVQFHNRYLKFLFYNLWFRLSAIRQRKVFIMLNNLSLSLTRYTQSTLGIPFTSFPSRTRLVHPSIPG